MFEVKIYLGDFATLQNTVIAIKESDLVNGHFVEDYVGFNGYIRVKTEELSATLSIELKHQIEEFGNVNPVWQYEYEFENKGFKFEVTGLKKFDGDYVYFEVI